MLKKTKEKLPKEYFSRLGKILKSELNNYNIIIAINQWAIPSIKAFLWTYIRVKGFYLCLIRMIPSQQKAYHITEKELSLGQVLVVFTGSPVKRRDTISRQRKIARTILCSS